MANIHNQDLNAYQKQFGLYLRTSGTSKDCIQHISKLYDSVCYETQTSILDKYSKNIDTALSQWREDQVVHAGDNLDIRSSARFEGGGSSGHDLHLYTNMLYKARIDVSSLDDSTPIVRWDDIDYSKFILNHAEESMLMNVMSYLVKTSWKTYIDPTLRPDAPLNKYASEMATKTEKVSISILM